MSYTHPLLPPEADTPLLKEFLRANCILADQPALELLTAVASAFGRLPFENLTKIIKSAETGRAEEARRSPHEVLGDHWTHGTGGTCFALTATLLYLVRALGWRAEPILADRRYGADTHSALVVWIENRLHLLDPGYLIVRPLPLPTESEACVKTAFNELQLIPKDAGERIELWTLQDRQRTYRLTYRARPVDAGEFLRAWDTSFEADMMRYPVLSRVTGEQQIYLQKQHLLVRALDGSHRLEVTPDRLVNEIARQFNLSCEIVAKALEHLHRQGETHGRAFAS